MGRWRLPLAGPDWKVDNRSCRPDVVLAEILAFTFDLLDDRFDRGTIRIIDAPFRRSYGEQFAGAAGDRRLHGLPLWAAGARYSVRITVPSDAWDGYGMPRACWHSTRMRHLAREGVGIDPGRAYRVVAAHAARGETRFGRWPIYHVDDWAELTLHLVAHELAHILQYQRERGAGGSEVFCEDFAAAALDAWRDHLMGAEEAAA